MFCQYRPLLIVIAELFLIHGSFSCGSHHMIFSGVTEADKQQIISMHNRLRQAVARGHMSNQPPATNMLKLTWSDDLAQRAQYWASSCALQAHDPGRHVGALLVGQNVATKWTNYYDDNHDWVGDAITKWFNENAMYQFNTFHGHPTGHYTQLIWASTASVGCGFAFYTDEQQRYTKKYVCNYGPSGNVIGEEPYQRGYPSCFNHGFTESIQYPGLCEISRSSGYAPSRSMNYQGNQPYSFNQNSNYRNGNNKPYHVSNYNDFFSLPFSNYVV